MWQYWNWVAPKSSIDIDIKYTCKYPHNSVIVLIYCRIPEISLLLPFFMDSPLEQFMMEFTMSRKWSHELLKSSGKISASKSTADVKVASLPIDSECELKKGGLKHLGSLWMQMFPSKNSKQQKDSQCFCLQ